MVGIVGEDEGEGVGITVGGEVVGLTVGLNVVGLIVGAAASILVQSASSSSSGRASVDIPHVAAIMYVFPTAFEGLHRYRYLSHRLYAEPHRCVAGGRRARWRL